MPYLKLSSGTVHYLDQGKGAPLLLLSANPGDSRDWEAVLPALSSEYRVLALDWPGYGGSDIPANAERWTVLDFATVLGEFMARLQLPPALLIGNSVGGNVAARLAAKCPESIRGVVLVAPGGFTPHNAITRAFCRLMGSRWALSPRLWASLYLRKRTPTTQAMLARAAGEQSAAARLPLNRALWRSFGGSDNDLRVLAGQIAVPTLLMFGRADPAIPASKDGRVAAQCLPQAKLEIMPCGHAAYAEVPDLFLDAALPFLRAC